MMPSRHLLAIGLAVAIIIGVAAVFLAAGGPDGLESTALVVLGEKSLTGPAPSGTGAVEGPHPASSFLPPFPDYTLGEGTGHTGQVLAIVLGIALVFGAAFGITRFLGRPGRTREKEQDKE
jgi:cobalt/nickel transport protein